jgi:hypothetical protein
VYESVFSTSTLPLRSKDDAARRAQRDGPQMVVVGHLAVPLVAARPAAARSRRREGEGSDERDAQADETALAVPPILEGARRQHCTTTVCG